MSQVISSPISSPIDTATSTPHRARRMRRLLGVLTGLGLAGTALTGLASPASATVDAGGAYASEVVLCNSVQHTVTMTFNTVGYFGGVTGQLPVYVHVWQYVGGHWVAPTSWAYVPGTRSIQFSRQGTSYYYFEYAFQTPNNTFVTGAEWAGGGPASGWYADQRGYRTLPSCVS